MKSHHPLAKAILETRKQIHDLCTLYAQQAEDSIQPTYTADSLNRINLQHLAAGFTGQVEDILTYRVRETIQETLNDLEQKIGKVLSLSDRLEAEEQIEKAIKKPFAGNTVAARLVKAKHFVYRRLLETYRFKLSGLAFQYEDAFLASGLSIFRWVDRLIVSEMLRTYHYTVQSFANLTGADSIDFQFDSAQLERDELYKQLAEGGPYKVDALPDYPRPYASYILKIHYES